MTITPNILPSGGRAGRFNRRSGADAAIFSPHAEVRLRAAQAQKGRARRALEEHARDWPPNSPAAVNAWLLLATTKPPTWCDNLVLWQDHPPSIGRANEGFYYPDPLGFWAEIRRWSLELFQREHPNRGPPDALALTTLLHVGDQPARITRAIELSAPQMILFLDGPSWERSGLEVHQVLHHIEDPHRTGQVYEGFWGHTADGRVVGKAPQHPTTHNLYRDADMIDFLRSAPAPNPSASQEAHAG
ncbi:MAG: hypothetical protein ACR2HV_07860 [Acidimicrobiales bacterium]